MGLDTSHGCWHGSYSAFTRWRNKLAEVAGYELKTDESHYTYAAVLDNERARWTDENYLGHWNLAPEDPLLVLLVHSDCGGIIPNKLVPWLRMRIEQLLPLLPDEEVAGHIGHWRTKTQMFIDGLKAAEEDGEDVEFW